MMAGSVENNADHLIAETVLSSSVPSVTFDVSSLAALGYKHLQIRMVARDTNTGTGTGGIWLQMNGDTANNYSWHRIGGANGGMFSGNSLSTSKILAGLCSKNPDSTGVFGSVITDILDWSSSNKNKTIRSLAGNVSSISLSSMEINLTSGAWFNTAAITSILISSDTSFASGSRFSLYASKG
jgi:hypothetical protein